MIQANSWLALLPAADSSFWMLVVAAVGMVAGRLLTSLVGGLLDSGAFDYEEPVVPVPAGSDRLSGRRVARAATRARASSATAIRRRADSSAGPHRQSCGGRDSVETGNEHDVRRM